MLRLLNYQITEKLYESANSQVYRAQHLTDRQPVILKILKQAYPSPEKIAGFKREYEISRSFLNLEGLVAAYGLENEDNRLVMILEDFGGESLTRLNLVGNLSLTNFLILAIEIVEILAQVHQRHIIHKDINPSNIIFNPTKNKVKLIDFGISTVLSREITTFRNPDFLEGTLAYISPEQTGRMNRVIDYRTDFYSLGVTFYEILTGQLPFTSDDALELLHYHLARKPLPPHKHQSNIPLTLSKIVLKLMAKNAEDRYKSLQGLKKDLEECLKQWQTKRQIDSFSLAKQDISDRFQIPQKLYGRKEEIKTLIAAIERVSQGRSEMMLVSGYSGIGKSALVQEVYKPITHRRGYFISGKFDQFQRDIPYSSMIQAFRSLVKQLLTESEKEIATWRLKLLETLGSNGQVIIEVVPEIEMIIGIQPSIPELPSKEAQNRFNIVFKNFIKVFTQPQHPLVIFLDDLQWADRASLQLIQLLMTEVDSKYLLLFGAYRNNEVSLAHPLILTLEALKKAKATVNRISLSALKVSDVTQLLVDTLYRKPQIVRPLAELIHNKTGGNPFFLIEFLKSLYVEKLLIFKYSLGFWTWDLEQIQSQKITDNVVEFMATKAQNLPPQTQAVLKLASCIGNQFDLKKLAIVCEKSPQATAEDLWPALINGFILPLTNAYKFMELDVEGLLEQLTAEYKFAHDRIQQAVYSLIPEANKQNLHLRIGQLLLKNTSLEEQKTKIFDIVNHLNQGRLLIQQKEESYQLAQLNLRAGKKAKASSAYQAAFSYLNFGIELLEKDRWQKHYNLSLELYAQACEAAFLNGKLKEMDQLTELVLKEVSNLLDKVVVYKVKILACMAQSEFSKAIEIGLQVLNLFGVIFPQQPTQAEIERDLEITKSIWQKKLADQQWQIENFIQLPKMEDTRKLAKMRILWSLLLPSYVVRADLFVLIVSKMVKLSLQYGNTVDSLPGYCWYGVILCTSLKDEDIDLGYQFGRFALNLLERIDAKEHKARTYLLVGHFIRHWKESIRCILPSLLEGYQSGLEVGDLEYGTLSAATYCIDSYFIGKELLELELEMRKYGEVIAKYNQETILNWHQIYWQGVLNLLGRNYNPCRLIGEVYDEEKMIPLHKKMNDRSSFINLYLTKLMLSYQFQQLEEAVNNADKAKEYYSNASGSIYIPILHFYDSLARLGVFYKVTEEEQKTIIETINSNQKKMEIWAKNAPMNCLHKFYLVEAERSRILGQDKDAREYYDQAIILAQDNEYLNEEALAYELAGRFYLSRDQKHVAHHYLQDAHYAYQRWGAIAKVKDLEERYPQFLATASKDTLSTSLPSATVSEHETSTEIFDFHSVLRASQAISSEILLDKLLEKLIKIMIENAGAQTAFLLLEKEGQLLIEAEANINNKDVIVSRSDPIETSQKIPLSIINYVQRTRENIVLKDASTDNRFTKDAYLIKKQPKSVLCAPILNQGKLIGLLYLENNLTTGAFTSERIKLLNILSAQAAISIDNSRLYQTLEQKVSERTHELSQTLEILKATQAELIFENELLRSAEQSASFDYQVGGSLSMDSPTYVVRSADRYLYKALKRGEFCYILNPRQMGKSSLMVRMIKHLQHEEVCCAAIDMTRIGSEKVTIEQWYKGFAFELGRGFGLRKKINLKAWWNEREDISPVQRLSEFIEEVLLVKVGVEDDTLPKQVVIFVDEIDSILGLNFSVNDFFALIRSCYNQRGLNRDYQRLTFALFGAATPSDLITNIQTTPFNIGQSIQLEGFKEHEAQPLLQGLAEKVSNPQTVLKEILAWTSGQPFLTQKLCQFIRNASSPIPEGAETAWIEHLVQTKVIKNWQSQDQPEHLKTICDRLLKSQQSILLLELYRQVLHQGEVACADSSEERELLLSGLVVKKQGFLKVNNRIYESIFDRNWIEQHISILLG